MAKVPEILQSLESPSLDLKGLGENPPYVGQYGTNNQLQRVIANVAGVADADPPMTRLVKVDSDGFLLVKDMSAHIPSGAIVLWYGAIAGIPAGWFLCDGNNGTPDLRDRFIVAAKQDDGGIAKTNLTGSLTYSGGNVNHVHVAPGHTHGLPTDTGGTVEIGGGAANGTDFTASADGHTHALGGNTGSGGASNTGNSSAVAVPYYALAYIMKS